MDTPARPRRVFDASFEKKDNNSISLIHPKFKGRADRLDLITNQMVGFKAAIGDKNFTICDLSETGFSYAERVPVKKNLSFKQVKTKVDQIAESNYSKSIKCVCFFDGKPEWGSVEAKGTIKNHHLFLVLSPDEIKRTVTSYLQSKAIRRSHDPHGYFSKLDLILSKSDKLRRTGYNEATLGIVINTTFQNLILEIGASVEIFEKLYQGYINKPVYVKYGVAVEEKKDAFKIMKFATTKNAGYINHNDEQKSLIQQQRIELINKLNSCYSFKDFVLIIWNQGLQHFNLAQGLPLPIVEKEKVMHALAEEKIRYDGHLEKLVDPDFIEGNFKGLENYLCDGFYWHLIEKDKKYFDRAVIIKEIRQVVGNCYEECLKSQRSLS